MKRQEFCIKKLMIDNGNNSWYENRRKCLLQNAFARQFRNFRRCSYFIVKKKKQKQKKFLILVEINIEKKWFSVSR